MWQTVRLRRFGRLVGSSKLLRSISSRPVLETLEDRIVLSLFNVPSSILLGSGTAPQSIASGDFRGSGRLDLAVADHGNNSVSVLLSNGDGTFAAPASYPLGANMNPTFITSANLNADAKPDLIVVDNANSGFVSVLINNGDGTFATPVKYAVGANPVGVGVADFNGDGKQDLAVANNGGSSLTVLLNQGDGTFVAQAPFALPAAPVSITAGDFNNDNKNDVAVVAGGKVDIFTGTGSGSFNATPAQYTAGGSPGFITTGSLHTAGQLDLVVVNNFPSSNGVSVLLNNGSGVFANGVQYDLGTSPGTAGGQTANSVAVGDLNNDGVMDIAVANGQFGNNNGVSVLLGHGDGTFGGLTNWVSDEQAVGVVMGNFVGDAKIDLAVVNQASNDVTFLRGNGDGTFVAPPTMTNVSGSGPVVTGDFTGDGKQDAIVGNTFSLNGVILTLFAGHGDGTFAAPTTINKNITNPATGQAKELAAAFMNGDGSLDLIMLDANKKLDVFMNNGSGGFAAPVAYSAGTNPTAMTVGDFNGDGKPDVAIVNAGANNTTDGTAMIYLNDGSGGLTLVAGTPDIGLSPTGAAAGDLDGDHKDDLIVTNNNGFNSTVSVLISAGAGAFATKVSYAVDGDPTAVAAAPLRVGGKPDLAISTFFGPGLDILLNNGNGTFAASKSFATGSNPVSVTINDVTRDGIPDVETTDNFGDSLTVWAGVGDGTLAAAAQTFTVGDRPSMTAAADFNNDGFLDLVTTNGNASSVTFLLTGPGAATVSAGANANANFGMAAQSVSLSATVTTAGVTVNEGTETFSVWLGATPIGSPVTVPVVNGAAATNFTLPAGTPAGAYVIKAAFNGSANFASSVDTSKTLQVGAAGTTTTATAATVGVSATDQTVSLSATVASAGGTVNVGTETFTLMQGGTVIGSPVTVNVASGAAAASYTLPGGTAVGSYTIKADYTGDGNFGNSTDSSHALTVASSGQVQFSSATFSVNESDPKATITLTRTGGSFGAASVTFATGGGTAPAGSDYTATTTTVNWAAGDQSSKTVTVPLINHNTTGASTETVGLTINQATGAALGSQSTATLTINETPSNALPSQLNFSVSMVRAARNAGNGVITLIRTGGLSSTVSVQVSTSDGTAQAGTDYAAKTVTLTFGPNVTAQTVSIALLNSPQSGGRTINVALSNPGGGAVLATPNSMVLTITDPLPVQLIPKNLTAIASAFTHDAEALGIFVINAYHLYLKRSPDAGGLSHWVDQLQHQGLTDEMLETSFISSSEYIQNHGGTGAAWVTGMYQDLLGRNPDPGGLSHWTGVLAGGGSAFNVALGFAASAEREGQRIAGDYQIYLGRKLDASGQTFWVNQFLNGARNEDVVAGFVGSQEYYQNANKGQSNRTAWVDAAFQDIYHRDPTAAELAKWLGQMN